MITPRYVSIIAWVAALSALTAFLIILGVQSLRGVLI